MIIKELVYGRLVGEADSTTLRLDAQDAGNHVYLAYALVTQGPGHHVLPSVPNLDCRVMVSTPVRL